MLPKKTKVIVTKGVLQCCLLTKRSTSALKVGVLQRRFARIVAVTIAA